MSVAVYKTASLEIDPDQIAQHLMSKALDAETVKDEKVLGWSNRYPGDSDFEAEGFMVTDSELHFMFVEAQRKAPESAVQAQCQKLEVQHMEENGLSMISRRRKNEIKKEVVEALAASATVSYDSTEMYYMAEEGYLIIASTSVKKCDTIISLFMETLPVTAYPAIVGNMCPTYSKDDHEPLDLRVEDASDGLEDNDMVMARDFLIWLWYMNETADPITIPVFDDVRTVEIGIEGPLQFVNEGASGAFKVKVDKGLPTLAGEAQNALSNGKKLQKAKISLAMGDEIYVFAFDADSTTYSGLKCPDGEAMSRGDRISERAGMIVQLNEIITQFVNVFAAFVADYANRQEMLEWVNLRYYLYHQ
jgi:hypothetical protein